MGRLPDGEEKRTRTYQPSGTDVLKKRRTFTYILVIMAVSAFFIFLQTHLPFFKKFMPIGDNKLLIVILNINLLVILLLIFYVIRTLVKTYIEKKRGLWGSGLKAKLVAIFSVSIISSSVLFILSTWFFYVSMDKWFSEKVEDSLENARELSRFYYEDLFGRYEKTGDRLVQSIEDRGILDNERKMAAFVKRQGKSNFFRYLSIVNLEGEPLKTYSSLGEETNRLLLAESKAFVRHKRDRHIVPLKHGELLVFLTPIHDIEGETAAFLLLGEQISVQGTKGVKHISETYIEFRNARALKKIVKYGFLIPLFLVTMLTIVGSIWLGRKMATEIAVPLERVREGAAIIARGRFDINLEEGVKDEIGTLVSAFNRMARELKVAKDEVEERRRYMEVIVDNVATGIITTDVRGNILLLNRAAKDILQVKTDAWKGTTLRNIVGDDFRKIIRTFLKGIRDEATESVAKEMILALQNDTLYLRTCLTVLRDEAGKTQGYIATFDDITQVVRAEKLATWREIAKRLTHEIKNPLTPIKLSAERLRRRLLPKTEGKEKEVLDESTSVILSATGDITTMVNELTKLSQAPGARTIEDVNAVIEETVNMYRNLYSNILFEPHYGKVPAFGMDRDKIRRVFINLFTNSIKAIGSNGGAIALSTRFDRHRNVVWIEVADTGEGIKDEDKGKIFDPYFTRNHDGTGLGLAIVNSIILEHSGRITIEDNQPKGTKMVIELPVFET
jgi:two-component system nitrogen regulation sensor histidine kinase NtrY